MTSEQGQAPRRVRPRPRLVEVERIERLTPGCVRVVFTGDELEGYASRGPAEHIKVMFPAAGERRLALPEWGPEGPLLSAGQKMPPSRTYTPRAWDAQRGELTVDFMVHGQGLAADWVQDARPGDVVAVTNPGGPYTIDARADWYVIGGDESALPAMNTILEALPAGIKAHFMVEVVDAGEEQPLDGASVTWLHRGRQATPGASLEQALRTFEFPSGDGRVWVGCEASIMRNIRRHLIDDLGMDRGQMHTHGYWKLGTENHPDHDVGQEI